MSCAWSQEERNGERRGRLMARQDSKLNGWGLERNRGDLRPDSKSVCLPLLPPCALLLRLSVSLIVRRILLLRCCYYTYGNFSGFTLRQVKLRKFWMTSLVWLVAAIAVLDPAEDMVCTYVPLKSAGLEHVTVTKWADITVCLQLLRKPIYQSV